MIGDRWRQLRQASDAGVTIVELLVVMMISALVLAMVGSFFVQISRTTVDSTQRKHNMAASSIMLTAISRVLRSATPVDQADSTQLPAFVEATPRSVEFYTLDSTDPSTPVPTRARVELVGDGIVIKRWSGTSTAGTPATTQLSGVISAQEGDAPLFVYRDSTDTTMVPTNGALSADQRSSIASVTVSLRARSVDFRRGPAVLVVSTVGLPNVRISRTANP